MEIKNDEILKLKGISLLGYRPAYNRFLPISLDILLFEKVLFNTKCLMFVDNFDLITINKDIINLISKVENIQISMTPNFIEKVLLKSVHYQVPYMNLELYGSNYRFENLINDLEIMASKPQYLIFDNYYLKKILKTEFFKQLKDVSKQLDINVIFLTDLVHGNNNKSIVETTTGEIFSEMDFRDFDNVLLIDEHAYFSDKVFESKIKNYKIIENK